MPPFQKMSAEVINEIRRLRIVQGLSVTDTAEELGIAPATVRKHTYQPWMSPEYRLELRHRTQRLERARRDRLILDLRASGMTCSQVAAAVRCSVATVRGVAPGRPTKVPTEPLREYFLREGLSPADIARGIGWYRQTNGYGGRRVTRPDTQRVRRALGIGGTVSHGKKYFRKMVEYDTAAALARAMGADPVDMGL